MLCARLPQELIDKTVDEILPDQKDGRRALVNYSLVCSAFLERCRARLYRKLRIDSKNACEEACAIAGRNPGIIDLVKHIRIVWAPATFAVMDVFRSLQVLEMNLVGCTESTSTPFQLPAIRDVILRSYNLTVPLSVVATLLSICNSLSSLTLANLKLVCDIPRGGQKPIPVRRLVISSL